MSFKPLLAVTLTAALAACAQTHTGQPGNGAPQNSRIVQAAPQDAAIHRSKIGAYDLIALNLDIPGLNPELFDGRPFSTAQINEIANRNHAPKMPDGVALQGALNAYLLHTGNRLMVIDTGMADGQTFVDKIRQAGYRPEQVDVVLLTHTHRDHTGGLMTNGKATFPNATVYLSAAESKLDSAHSVLAAYGGRIKTFTAGDTLFDGIKTVDLAGHTAGHVGYEITSQGQTLLIWGDIVHNAYIQFDTPEAALKYDADEHAARRTRQAIFAQTAKDGTSVAGMHLPFPGIGQVQAARQGKYRWANRTE